MRLFWHSALTVLGVLAVVWSLTLAASPTIMCREVVMKPGDVCANAEGTRTQTYEERFDAAQNARPVVGVLGGVMAGFGLWLAVSERRRQSASAKLIGP